VSGRERDEDELGLPGPTLLHCGECGTWRSVSIGPWVTRALDLRLRRDRRRMARLLRLLEEADAEVEVRSAARR
jgi:hypothetical protein